MRISLSRCIWVQRQHRSGVMDRLMGKVIMEKVSRFQGQSTADNYCNRSSHTANNTQCDDWNMLKQFLVVYSLHETCFINGHTKHPCTGMHLCVQPSWLQTGLYCLGEGSQRDFRWIFCYPSIPICSSPTGLFYWSVAFYMAYWLCGTAKHTLSSFLVLCPTHWRFTRTLKSYHTKTTGAHSRFPLQTTHIFSAGTYHSSFLYGRLVLH